MPFLINLECDLLVDELLCDLTVEDLEFDLTADNMEFGIDFGVITERDVDHEWYDGPYEVTPKVYAQELSTSQKVAREDISVSEIPKFDVKNNTGTTVYIGSEVKWQ